jgi:putative oxidoreductase
MNVSSTASIRPSALQDSVLLKGADVVGRILLIFLFILAGLRQLGPGYAGTARLMAAHGVPAALLPLVILTELGGGLAVILGWKTRIAAFLLAGYTLLTALIFHTNFADPSQPGMFRFHMAVIGGFLILVANGRARSASIIGAHRAADRGRPAALIWVVRREQPSWAPS